MGQPSAATQHANVHPWSFFVTLTFGGKAAPAPAYGFALQRRWLDRAAPSLLHQKATDLEWMSREELGELNGRMHYHVLVGEIRDAKRVSERTCLALMSEWEKLTRSKLGNAGMARCRVFMPNLDGAGYVLKGLDGVTDWTLRGANCYEVGKFSDELGRTVRLARCLLLRWMSRKGNKYSLQARSCREGFNGKCEL